MQYCNALTFKETFPKTGYHCYQSEEVVDTAAMPGNMRSQQSTETNLCGEKLPLLFRRLDVGSLSEGIAFESRLIGGRRAANMTLGHTDCDLREVQKTQRWMET